MAEEKMDGWKEGRVDVVKISLGKKGESVEMFNLLHLLSEITCLFQEQFEVKGGGGDDCM